MPPHLGLLCAILAYSIWGIVPIYWKQLVSVDSFEIVLHRMLWSFVFVLIYIVFVRRWHEFVALWKQPAVLGRLCFAAILNALNWGTYIWAVNAEHIIEVSMGYFINPIITVLFGVVLFAERLRKMQYVALSLVVIGIAYLVLVHGKIPYIALVLSVSFAIYSVMKKTIQVPVVLGLGIESGLLVLPALILLLYFHSQSTLAFGHSVSIDALLILGGLVTLTPLLLFSAAAKSISLTTLGMSQYIGPTLQLLIGVYLYKEPFDKDWAIAFGFIWLALIIYSLDQLQHEARRGLKRINS